MALFLRKKIHGQPLFHPKARLLSKQLYMVLLVIRWYHLSMFFIIRCKCFFLFIGREPTTWPANNCLQIMVWSCAMSFNSFWLQILFCLRVNETTLFSFLRSHLRENGRSLRFPKIFLKKQTRWSNDKTNIVCAWKGGGKGFRRGGIGVTRIKILSRSCILHFYALLGVVFCVIITVSRSKGWTVFCKLELHALRQENLT